MRHFRLASLLLALIATAIPSARAQQSEELDPKEVFLQAHMLLDRAKESEARNDFQSAYQQVHEASGLFDSISQQLPNWKTEMMDFRRKKVRAELRRLSDMSAFSAATESVPADPRLPQHRPSPRGAIGHRPNAVVRAPGALSARERFKRLEEEVEHLRGVKSMLIERLDTTRSESAEARKALEASEREVDRLQRLYDEAQTELASLREAGVEALMAQVEELKTELAQATESLRQANERTKAVLTELEAASDTIAEMKREQEELLRQRAEMVMIIKGLESGETTSELVTENVRLREQLNATRAQLDALQMEKEGADEEIFRLRAEVTQLREHLARVEMENESYRDRLLELRLGLTESERELSLNPPAIEDTAARAENELLRDVIARQLKQQTHREAIKQEILEDLKRDVDAGSSELLAKIEELSKELPITEKERAALRAGGISLPPMDASATTDEAAEAAAAAAVAESEAERLRQTIQRYSEAAAYNFGQGRFEAAEAYYREVLEFAPQNVETMCNLGVTQIRLNKLEDALTQFEAGLTQDPRHARSLFMLAVTRYHLQELEAAAEAIGRAVEIEPANAEYQHFFAVVHLTRGDLIAAETCLQEALENRRVFPGAHYNYVIVCLRKNPPDIASARQHYAEAKAQGWPARPELEQQLGLAALPRVPPTTEAPAAPASADAISVPTEKAVKTAVQSDGNQPSSS